MAIGTATQAGAEHGASRFPPRHADETITMRLAGGDEAAASARRTLTRLCGGDLDQPTMETLRLLVTELIANSVKHAHAHGVGMKVALGTRSVLVEVSDPGPGFTPVPRSEDQDDTSGWGLFLVERLSKRWGVSRDGEATRVWFELGRAG